jgi:predicted membrane chloride channel (bestrophin family)
VSNGKGRHKSWLQQWLQSWSRGLQSKRRNSVVVSYKVYTLELCVTVCDPINPVVNPIPVLYSRHIRAKILIFCTTKWLFYKLGKINIWAFCKVRITVCR